MEQQAAEQRLVSRGIDAAKLALFKERAAAASTPDQIDMIERQF